VVEAPVISVMLPRGMPPPRRASSSGVQVGISSGACLVLSVKALGARSASDASN
jgi:hypothetical protein